jgi:hypothetical protein
MTGRRLSHFNHLLVSATDHELANILVEAAFREQLRDSRWSITDDGRRALRDALEDLEAEDLETVCDDDNCPVPGYHYRGHPDCLGEDLDDEDLDDEPDSSPMRGGFFFRDDDATGAR